MRPPASVRAFPNPAAGALLHLIGSLIFGLLVLTPANSAAPAKPSIDRLPPRPPREFRGAWIATVANLDWPSKPGLSTAQQKSEFIAIADKAVQLKLNVLILQVRPACDAVYPSDLEPWSEFLSGHMGKAPEPFYDPLAFAVEEAHRRGLELHAWFNPFRARAPNTKSGLAPNHISRCHPEFVRSYGSQRWLDPGLKSVQEHSAKVILDVVRRYDIDGVHLDDYFYPYPENDAAGQPLDFPDNTSWQQYRASGGKLDREEWRRKNIDDFLENLYRKIKAQKRWVKLGVSPFGIWRPGFPSRIKKGLDAYERLHADSRKWLARGWVDYFVPQLYWAIDGEQSYPALLEWWAAQNPQARLLCPGNDISKVGQSWNSGEIIQQIRLTRTQRGTAGNVFWNASSLMRNNDHVGDRLSRELYTQAALIPATPWLDTERLPKPQLRLEHDSQAAKWKISWTKAPGVRLWLLQTRCRGKWSSTTLLAGESSRSLPSRGSAEFPELIALTAIDRCGVAGTTALLETERATATREPALEVRPTSLLKH